ncbi:MAG: hypothetical protein QME32_00370 [Endomicrobiia bacterium]|nr:hypothetical protein [Endomicrobiia bacterium]
MKYLGDYPVNASVKFFWNTNDATGASITRSTDGTLKIYKDGSVTERTSLSGVTQTEDFDSATGVHYVAIDLSDNTDVGFYAAGSEYAVVMTSTTIDSKTVNAVIGQFSIERSGGALALIKARLVGTIATGTHNPQTGDAYAIVNTRLPAALVGGRMASNAEVVGDKTGYSISGTKTTLDALNDITAASVWAVATRLLTAGTNIVLVKGTGITGFNDLSAAQVNAEAVDALATDTYAEPASIPAATSSLKDKIAWLFTLARNKITQTATTQTVRNDADGANIATSTHSDDGTTHTKGEWV